jgi:hypothetical protein
LNQLTKDQDLKLIGKQIADSVPALADLSESQLKEVASWYLKKKLTDDMKTLVKVSSIDLDFSRMHFLDLFDRKARKSFACIHQKRCRSYIIFLYIPGTTTQY